ncbi:DNA-binding protein [Wenjunlia vitaminophila]|uniref:DNA-binding protein n=1 Tax=Wenjunlia vitaminophila TaxID=76728 RepID=A0A0T6LKD5_WENVI|nr:helix-turn-helix transcriptional regulator [Wenjunlia vitaminophila]KRV46501.1 DNA-binding protein [Wenjunlia vitaminophila]
MAQWSDYTTGERLKILRGKDLTQAQLAERTGLSVKTVQKAEQGGTVSLPTLMCLADGLGTDVSVILGQQAPRRSMGQDERTSLRRIASAVHDTASGLLHADSLPADGDELRRIAERSWSLYWAGLYVELGSLLPRLTQAAAATLRQSPSDPRGVVRGVLSDAYQIAGCVANLLGARDLAYAAVGHARAAAELAEDPLRVARVDSARSWVYLRDARLEQAERIAEKAALSVEPRYSDNHADQLTVYGNLMVSAAVAASRRGDSVRSGDFMSQAQAAGARMGRDQHCHGAVFGPATATAEAVGINLALGETGKALRLIDGLRDLSGLPKAARYRHQLNVALAQCDARMWDASLDTLLDVCTTAPEWARHQALPGVIVQRVGDASTARVRKLSRILGVSVSMR